MVKVQNNTKSTVIFAYIQELAATADERPYYYQLTDKTSTTHRTLQHICKPHQVNAQTKAYKRAAILPMHPSPPTTQTIILRKTFHD